MEFVEAPTRARASQKPVQSLTTRRESTRCITGIEKPDSANSHLGQTKKACAGHRCLVEALCNANLGPQDNVYAVRRSEMASTPEII